MLMNFRLLGFNGCSVLVGLDEQSVTFSCEMINPGLPLVDEVSRLPLRDQAAYQPREEGGHRTGADQDSKRVCRNPCDHLTPLPQYFCAGSPGVWVASGLWDIT